MIKIETKRLIIKTNLCAGKGELVYPQNPQDRLSLLDLKPLETEDTGFAVYLKSDESTEIAHFSFRDDRKDYELCYGTKEEYRQKGYLYEALSSFFHWFFIDIGIEAVYGLIGDDNTASINLAIKLGFQPCSRDGSCTWYVLKKPEPLE